MSNEIQPLLRIDHKLRVSALDAAEEMILKIFNFQYTMGTNSGHCPNRMNATSSDSNKFLWTPADLGLTPFMAGLRGACRERMPMEGSGWPGLSVCLVFEAQGVGSLPTVVEAF